MDKHLESIKAKLEVDENLLNYLSAADLVVMQQLLQTHIKTYSRQYSEATSALHSLDLKTQVATMVKIVGCSCSCRRLAEIAFTETDDRRGIQYDGRELKRWAAVVLAELFTPSALLKADGDYWHEY